MVSYLYCLYKLCNYLFIFKGHTSTESPPGDRAVRERSSVPRGPDSSCTLCLAYRFVKKDFVASREKSSQCVLAHLPCKPDSAFLWRNHCEYYLSKLLKGVSKKK